MFDVIAFLVQEYRDFSACPGPDDLARKLAAVGFEDDVIHDALDWLSSLLAQGAVPEVLAESRLPRILTQEEREGLPLEVQDFVLFLDRVAAVNNVQREQILDRRRRILFFPPGSVLALVRWAANEHGTVLSRLDILRTVERGAACQTVPTVTPGAEVLLHVDGWPKVERVLQLIDAIEARGIEAIDVSPDHWRHVHNRLTAGEAPRAYDAQQHRAFLLRRRIMP